MNLPGTQPAQAGIDTRPAIRSHAAVLWCLAIFAVWAAVVAFAELHHDFWLDEVRALSLALDADSLLSVPAAIHGEGHPTLWYILLRAS